MRLLRSTSFDHHTCSSIMKSRSKFNSSSSSSSSSSKLTPFRFGQLSSVKRPPIERARSVIGSRAIQNYIQVEHEYVSEPESGSQHEQQNQTAQESGINVNQRKRSVRKGLFTGSYKVKYFIFLVQFCDFLIIIQTFSYSFFYANKNIMYNNTIFLTDGIPVSG